MQSSEAPRQVEWKMDGWVSKDELITQHSSNTTKKHAFPRSSFSPIGGLSYHVRENERQREIGNNCVLSLVMTCGNSVAQTHSDTEGGNSKINK